MFDSGRTGAPDRLGDGLAHSLQAGEVDDAVELVLLRAARHGVFETADVRSPRRLVTKGLCMLQSLEAQS